MPSKLAIPKGLKSFQTVAHRRSPHQEKQLAERLGGKRTPGSGNGDTKGDVQVRKIARIETKNTLRNSFSVTLEMVNKIEAAALASTGEVPAIVVEFIDAKGKSRGSVMVMPSWAVDLLKVEP
jgi:hypothetical protein